MKKLVTEAFKSLGKEPSLDTLIKAALKFAKAGMKNLEKLEIFSRRSAYLPRLKIIAENDIERDESLDRYQDEPDKWGADTDRDFGFLISAQWELGELIFNPDQVRVYNLIADTAKRREEIITWIVGLYFERRRLMIQAIIKPADDPMEMASAILRIHELGAQIDVLTGGRLMRDHGDRQ